MIKLMLSLSLFLVGCTTGAINPDKICIMYEKRFMDGKFVETEVLERKCE